MTTKALKIPARVFMPASVRFATLGGLARIRPAEGLNVRRELP
jgi:hypothetical protein